MNRMPPQRGQRTYFDPYRYAGRGFIAPKARLGACGCRRQPQLGVVTVRGRGSTFMKVLYWGMIGLLGLGALKAGRYALTGKSSRRGSGKLPPAWQVHG